ncbi:unnamed protein product [Bursaphelenchus xylophilus]|uniref:(pine wood nematode) hypothetical protein n=1 Tax=Bursaphelenchus xylophilus TaxID=6326 RepID=A0A1I7RZT9_BURXY|nr:unnamed protein product [Bursaphelenchus xylophilus]CAG9109240.1 unnamed protein product [Bursaphelenchus xylophilus]
MQAYNRFKDTKRGAKTIYHARSGYKQIRVFPEWTSAHAIPLVGRFHRFCSIFWLAVFLAGLGVVVYMLVEAIKSYKDYKVSVQQTLSFTSYPFPAITICDLNPYKRDIAYQRPEIKKLMDTYSYALQKSFCTNTTCNVPTNKTLDGYMSDYQLTGLKSSTAINSKVQKLLPVIAAQYDMSAAAAQYDDILQGCSFNLQDCQDGDWTKFNSQTMGTCFSYNMKGNKNVTRVGPIYGLRVIAKTNVSQLLPTSSKGGFRVLVHDQGEYPFPDVYGSDVMIESAASLGVSFTEISRLGGHYGSCHDDLPSGYLYTKNYSTEGCMRSEYQAEMVKNCGCYDPTYPAPANASSSSSDATTDLLNSVDDDSSNSTSTASSNETTTAASKSSSRIPMCTTDNLACWDEQLSKTINTNCSQPCHEVSYDTSVSFARWPSGSSSTVGICMSGDYGNETCLEMYQENGALIQVYFEQQSYETMKELAQYPLSTVFSNFGGQLGLWLGGSLIMVVEFVLLLVQCTLALCIPSSDKLLGY